MSKLKQWITAGALLLLLVQSVQASSNCTASGIALQVLGSGGPEITDQRASTGYLIWQGGRARVLIDMGPGSLQQFERNGARVEDLDVILLTHLHVDHSADLPALVKSSFFTARDRDLPLFGPTGNRFFAATERFVRTLFASPEGLQGVARNLHMPPSVIGKIADQAGVKQLVLSHRMNRTLGQEAISTEMIRNHYRGLLVFADDGQCFTVE